MRTKDVYLVDILAEVKDQMEEERLVCAADSSQAGASSFDKMTIVQRIKAVDAVDVNGPSSFACADGDGWSI